MEMCLLLGIYQLHHKISAKIYEFDFTEFVGTSDSLYALELSRSKISFLISDFEKDWNGNW